MTLSRDVIAEIKHYVREKFLPSKYIQQPEQLNLFLMLSKINTKIKTSVFCSPEHISELEKHLKTKKYKYELTTAYQKRLKIIKKPEIKVPNPVQFSSELLDLPEELE